MSGVLLLDGTIESDVEKAPKEIWLNLSCWPDGSMYVEDIFRCDDPDDMEQMEYNKPVKYIRASEDG